MIAFRDITIQDKDTITAYTMNSCRRNCDLSFSNLCSWRFLYHTKFAIINNFLVFKFWAGDELAYMMPVGEGNLEEVLNELIEDARQEGTHRFSLEQAGDAYALMASGKCGKVVINFPD